MSLGTDKQTWHPDTESVYSALESLLASARRAPDMLAVFRQFCLALRRFVPLDYLSLVFFASSGAISKGFIAADCRARKLNISSGRPERLSGDLKELIEKAEPFPIEGAKLRQPLVREGWHAQSAVVVPIRSRARVIACLTIVPKEPALAEQLAAQRRFLSGAGSLLLFMAERTYLSNSLRSKIRHIRLFYNMANLISYNPDLDEIFRILSIRLRRIVPFNLFSLAVLSADKSDFKLRISVRRGRDYGFMIERLPQKGSGPARALLSKRPFSIILDDRSPRLGEIALLQRLGIRFYTCIPLRVKGEDLGALCIGRRSSERPAARERRLLELLAEQLAVAIGNARLLEELRRTKEMLEESLHQLKLQTEDFETLVYHISHDVRAPLVSILGFVEILEKEFHPGLPQDMLLYLGRIVSNVRRVERLVHYLIGLAEIGKEEISPSEVLLSELLGEIMRKVEPELAEKAGTMAWDCDITLRAERKHLRRALEHIIENSIHYAQPGVPLRIEVGCRSEGDYWLITVKDNGIGIPEREFERIFAPFFRLEAARQLHPLGLGVGLTSARRIALMYGGSIGLESEEGKGSTFYVRFPKAPKIMLRRPRVEENA